MESVIAGTPALDAKTPFWLTFQTMMIMLETDADVVAQDFRDVFEWANDVTQANATNSIDDDADDLAAAMPDAIGVTVVAAKYLRHT